MVEVRVEFFALCPEPVSIGAVYLSWSFVGAAQDDASIFESGDENGCSFKGVFLVRTSILLVSLNSSRKTLWIAATASASV